MTKNIRSSKLSGLYRQNFVSFGHFTQIRCIPIQILIIQRFCYVELGLAVSTEQSTNGNHLFKHDTRIIQIKNESGENLLTFRGHTTFTYNYGGQVVEPGTPFSGFQFRCPNHATEIGLELL